jgi:hypothetical protein
MRFILRNFKMYQSSYKSSYSLFSFLTLAGKTELLSFSFNMNPRNSISPYVSSRTVHRPAPLYLHHISTYIQQIINVSFLYNPFETLHFIRLVLNTSY